MSIREIALDLTVFTLSNVNDAISFKPQLCFEVPKQDYHHLKENYINFTGTSIRKNRCKLFFLPTNVSDELQKLNASVPESAKQVPGDGRVYYKNRLITELDYENVKRVETACAFIAYTALNSFVHFETDIKGVNNSNSDNDSAITVVNVVSAGGSNSRGSSVDAEGNSHSGVTTAGNTVEEDDDNEDVSSSESVIRALKKGNILGFRELGHLVGITPWHFHRVFKIITGLTIREYGQLCVEFIKKNKELVNACRIRVEGFKASERYSCLENADFLGDDGLQYPAIEKNVVLLNEYFIDPNKSKEFKKKKGNNNNNVSTKSVQEENTYGVTQRSQIRKRRSSVVHGRIRRASQKTITSNSLNDCLTSPVANRSISFPQSDEENNDYNYGYNNYKGFSEAGVNNCRYSNVAPSVNFDNDTDESTSASSDWERPLQNIFPSLSMTTTRPTSPSLNSRKNSVISISSAGMTSSNNKISKKGGNLLDSHKRTRNNEGLGLNLDSLKDSSIDYKLSLAAMSAGTALGSSNNNSNTSNNNNATTTTNDDANSNDNMNSNNGNASAIEFNNNVFQRNDGEGVGFTNLDGLNNIFQSQCKPDPKLPYQNSNNEIEGNSSSTIARSDRSSTAAAIVAAFNNNDVNGIRSAGGHCAAAAQNSSVPSMTDVSLFNNSLLEQTATPVESLLLDTDPVSASTGVQEELDVDTLLNNSSSLLCDLAPFGINQHQRKDGTNGSELLNLPEENELFDSLNADLLASDAILSFDN